MRLESPNPQEQGRWGERSALAGDIDGDGVGDFWLSAFQENVGTATLAGRVHLISGRTRSVIYSVASPEPQNNQRFGFTVASPGDLNGDGKRDVVVGADVHDDTIGGTTYVNTGKAWAFNGATGTLLYALSNPHPQSNPELPFSKVFGFGVGISSAGDMTADGRPEILVGASSNDVPAGCGGTSPPTTVPAAPCRRDQGQGYVFNGATGGLIRTYTIPAGDLPPTPACNTDLPGPGIGTCGFLGFAAAGVGDVNADGYVDHQFDAGTYDGPNGTTPNKDGRIYVFSGHPAADPQVPLLRIDSPIGDQGRIFGLQTVQPGAPGDLNGDGRDDIYGNCFSCADHLGQAGGGRAWMFSGADGSILYNVLDPSPEAGGGFAFSGAKTDFDRDGREDEFIAGQNGSGTTSGGGATVFGVPSAFGPSLNAPALKDFHPPPEDAAANPSAPPGNGLRFGRTVEAPGDLNQDGEPDYVVGAPHTDVGANPDQGRVYVFLSRVPRAAAPGPAPPTPPGLAAFAGCPSLTANVIRGSAAGGRITGTVRGDRIFGGTGNDIVDGLAGNDCIDLGPGTDTGQGGLGNDLLLGGLGQDRMAGSSGNDRVRGGPSADRINGGFGNDVLHGQAGKDRVSGSRGRDRVNGGSASDVISAGSSNDRVAGDQGSDRINGNSGNDVLKGNSGNDRIKGSTGRDRMSAGGGNDRVDARDGRGGDRIACGIGRDSVVADSGDRVARDCERVVRRR